MDSKASENDLSNMNSASSSSRLTPSSSAGGSAGTETKTSGLSIETQQNIQFWRDFQFDTQRQQWDKVCNEMRELKTASMNGRKRLNDLTKAFRAMKTKEEQVNSVMELVKAYQEEIDQLSRRSKFSESSYLGIHKSLYDAPNPVEIFEILMANSISESSQQLEIDRLTSELRQYDQEFQQLKNQDITIRRLEDQIASYKQQNEGNIEEEVKKRLKIIEEECDERIQSANNQVKVSERRVTQVTEQLKALQFSYERTQSQLFEVSNKSEEKVCVLTTENQTLAESVNRWQLRCIELEKEVTDLKQRLSSLLDENNGDNNGSSSSALGPNGFPLSPTKRSSSSQYGGGKDPEAYELVITQLRSELRMCQDSLTSDKLRYESSLRDQSLNLAREKEQVMKMKQELQERPSRAEFFLLKKRLATVQRIAFHSSAADGDDDDDIIGNGKDSLKAMEDSAAGLGPESVFSDQIELETLLAKKIQSLETDLTDARKTILELKSQESDLRSQVHSLKNSLETSSQLIKRLEIDLDQRNQALEKLVTELTTLQSQLPANGSNASTRSQQDDFAELLGVNNNTSSSASTTTTTIPQMSAATGNQMISILQSQRDRYKDKLAETEASMIKLQEQIDSLQTSKKQLEADNVSLYSKMKFLQSYNGNNNHSSTVSHNSMIGGIGSAFQKKFTGTRGSSSIEEGRYNDDDVEGKYSAIYENQMNPFAEFSSIERQRKLRELTVGDRIVLNTAMAVISNRTGRNVLMIYFGAMHILVFVTIYYVTHNVHHGCDPALDNLHHRHIIG